MKNLTNKFKKGVRQLGKKVLPVAGTILTLATIQDADAQKRKFPVTQDKNAYFYVNDKKSQYSVEPKKIYGDLFYMHYREPESEDALITNSGKGLAGLALEKTIPVYNLNSKDIVEMRSKGEYIYRKVKLSNGEYANEIAVNIDTSNLSNDQILEKFGIPKGDENAIYQIPMERIIPNLEILSLEDGTKLIPLEISEEFQTESKTDHYFVQITDSTLGGFNLETNKLELYAPIYRGFLKEGEVVIKRAQTDAVKSGKTSETRIITASDETKTSKADCYLIFGVEVNKDLEFKEDKISGVQGILGIQYGPVAIVGNLGNAKDEIVKEKTSEPSPRTGRYGYGTEDNKDISVMGISAELHPFHNKKVSPFIIGGINKWNYITETVDEIRDANDNVVESKSNSKPNSARSYKIGAGINFKVNKSQLGVRAGYDNKAQFYAGATYSLRLGR